MKVYSLSQKKLIEVPDDQAQGGGQPQAPETQSTYITGYSPQEHLQALQQARAAGDKNAEADIMDNYTKEYQYQKDQRAYADKAKAEAKADAKPTAAQEKKQTATTDAERIMSQLEKLYFGGEGSQDDLSKGRLGGLGSGLMAALGENQPLRTYADARDSARATLARAFGDVGNLSQSEQENAIKLLPTARSTPEEAAAGFQALREKLNLSKGKVPASQKKESGNPLYDAVQSVPGLGFLLGGAQNVAQDVGTSMRYKQNKGSFAKDEQTASFLESQAQEEKNPQTKKLLLKQANDMRAGVSSKARDIQQGFSEDVKNNPVGRSVSAAAGIVGTSELATSLIQGLLKSGGKKAVESASSPGTLQKILKPTSTGSTIRNEAVKKATEEGSTIEGDKIFEATRKWAENVTPNLRGKAQEIAGDTAKAFSNKQVTPDEAFKLWEEARKGFSAAGKTGSSLEAGYNRVLRDVIRQELEQVAPGFNEGTKLISKGLGRSQFLKKLIIPTAVGASVGVPLSVALGKILNPNK